MTSDIAIQVEGLSKQYKIGATRERHDTLRDHLMAGAGKLVRRNGNRANPSSDTIWALKDVSFEVKRGEVVGVIGRNGAGKSTLLKILSRITEPTSGYADIHGRIGSLLEVGTGFHPELTGRENIYLNGAILGMKRAEITRKFDEIVAFAEVEKFIDTPVKRYSSGMYVRLAFAVAAHMDTEILLIDEVLAVGDLTFQKKCLTKMRDVAHEGRTVLTVSHNMGLITNICQQAIWLEQGSCISAGPLQQVVTAYEKNGSATSSSASYIKRPDAQRKRRAAWIEWLELLNDKSMHTNIFDYGGYLTMRLRILGDVPVATYFEWVLLSERGQVATTGGTFFKADNLVLPTPSGIVAARIGPLPLAEGHYTLTLRLGERPGHDLLDVWDEATSVLIARNIPEAGGIAFDSRWGVVYVPATYYDGGIEHPKHEEPTNWTPDGPSEG